MAVVRLSVGRIVEIEGRTFEVLRRRSGGRLQLEAEDDDEIRNYKELELLAMIEAGQAFVISPDGQVFPEIYSDFSLLPEREREEAERRLAYVSQVEKFSGHMAGKVLVEESIRVCARARSDTRRPSTASVYRWRRAYNAAGNDAAALVPNFKRRGNSKRRLPTDTNRIIDEVIRERYLDQRRIRVPVVHQFVKHRVTEANKGRSECDQLAVPSLRAVYRAVDRLPPYEHDLGRFGKYVADMNAKSVGAGAKSEWPLQRVEIDHTQLDIMVCDAKTRTVIGRPTFTIVLDHYSRMPLGYYVGFDSPGTEAVMSALRMAIMQKSWVKERYPDIEGDWPCYGVPETLVTDNGKEFHAHDLEVACRQLGVDIQHTPAKSPWVKGVVERFIQQVNWDAVGNLPGKTFHSHDARGDYKSTEEAAVTFQDLEWHLCKWIVDVHAMTIHRGIDNTPYQQWIEGTENYKPRTIGDAKDLLPLIHYKRESRKVHPKGVVDKGIYYNSDRLQKLRNSRNGDVVVTLKINTNDLASVIVADPTSDSCFEVPAIDQDYAAGLRYWQHMKIRELVHIRNGNVENRADLARAREDLFKAGEEARRSRRPSAKAARFTGTGDGKHPANQQSAIESSCAFDWRDDPDAAPLDDADDDYWDADPLEDDDLSEGQE